METKLLADLLKVKKNSVILEKIDGSESEHELKSLSKSDRYFCDQRRASDLDFKDTSFHAKVIAVKDGDTIGLLINNKQHNLRLNAIDAPELGQAFSRKSKSNLSKLVAGKFVLVTTASKDKYGRLLGDVKIGNKNVNEEQIKAGLAWHYKKYSSDPNLSQKEQEAKSRKKGLWSEANPIPPWEFRKWGPAKRKQYAQLASGDRARAPPKQATPNRVASSRPAMSYWLNTSSNVRHNRSCRWYGNTKRGRPCTSSEGKACSKCGG